MADFRFESGGGSHSIQLSIDSSLRQRYQQASRVYSYTGARPSDWKLQYYRMFVQHNGDQGTLRALLQALRAISPADDSAAAQHAIAFVQTGIAYDFARAATPMDDGLRYPFETLAEGKGVCADKSLLLARLLLDLGYGVALFTFDRANHMALGLQVPAGQGDYGSEFAYVETTDAQPIGLIPTSLRGGVRLDGRPEIVVLGKGASFDAIRGLKAQQAADQKQYGKDFLHMNPVQQQLKKEMLELEAEIAALKVQMRGCTGTLPPDRFQACARLQAEHNAKVAEYNGLVSRFNAANR